MASSFEKLKPTINGYLRSLKECDDFAEDLVAPLAKLSRMVLRSPDPHAFGLYLIEESFDEICLHMLTNLRPSLNQETESQSRLNLTELLSLTLNISDGCREFGDALVARGCTPMLLAMEGISAEVRINDLILAILHNCIRMSSNNRAAFRDANAIGVLQPLLESSSAVIQTGALMILAYVVDEDERKILATSELGLIQLLLILKAAVGNKSQRAVIKGTTTSFSVFETLDAINQLALNDACKAEIERQGAIPAIIGILQDEFSDDEHRVAVEAIWNLSFVESIRDSEILQSTVPVLEKLSKSSNKAVQRVCASALWQIKGSTSEKVSPSTSTEKPPPSYKEATAKPGSTKPAPAKVMLSYQWDHQKRVLKIREKLEDAGLRVWMDVSNIEGDILGAMANAVEESDVILMCMSERYRDSKSCRSEVTYAYKLEKKIIPLRLEAEYTPDGWLGLLQGMDLYYACYSDEELDRNMAALLKVIGGTTQSKTDDIDGPITLQTQPTSQAIPPPRLSSNPAAADWSAQDVQDWLIARKLKCPTLDDFEGYDLQELYRALVKDEEKFKAEMKSDYNMNGPTRTRFTAGLRRLFQK